MNSIQEQFQILKNRIEKENKFNKSKRRLFSAPLKSDIISLMNEHHVTMAKISKEFKLAHSTIHKWKKEMKPSSSFKKISAIENKNDQKIYQVLKFNLICLTTLLTLLVIERIFQNLVV